MLQFVNDIAEPFFEKFKTLDDYLEYILNDNLLISYKDQIVPIVYYLMGRKQDACDYIDSRQKDTKRKGYTDIGDSVFISNFFSLLSTTTQSGL